MNNNNCISLGNVINVIKKISNNNSAMQTEIFCSIFGVNDINATTVNNYCIGIRAIGLEYKNIFENSYNNNQLLSNILSIISILDNKIYSINDESLDLINNNTKLSMVIDELIKIAEIDEHIENIDIFKKDNNYDSIKEILYYAILVNKQPIYTQDINIKFDKYELNEYMKVKLYWGESYISSLLELSSKNNVYACAELGSLEFDGEVSGKVDFNNAYNYYLKAANKNHPKACWMIANLILTNRVNYDFEVMWTYLNKSIKLGSAAGYNTLGLCYLRGITKDKKVNKEKAKYNFKIASELGYAFAFNNLGKMYEDENDIEEAIKYYKISADMNNSWALNKMGEYYRKNDDLKRAYIYYSKAIECPIKERNKYAYYNLAKYYYEQGYEPLNIEKNEKLANEYYKIFYNM
ncbi:MAG: tetratricopeptide repeat protein [bacterium]|nr:tetratricopeptide repeat protein [bacterium]